MAETLFANKRTNMKALSIDILNRIKWFLSVAGSRSEQTSAWQGRPFTKNMAATVTGGKAKKNLTWHYFKKSLPWELLVGPFIFLNPDLFD
jgi:hypothetical protein